MINATEENEMDINNNSDLKKFKLDWLNEVYADWAEANNLTLEDADRYYFRVVDGAESDATADQVKWLKKYEAKRQLIIKGF